ncbi:MAG: tonB dependent receptor family protein [Noviherbaspirillum sp.]|nr:tonB dependent receptor family protein [Noviherbaspirillum sp.]
MFKHITFSLAVSAAATPLLMVRAWAQEPVSLPPVEVVGSRDMPVATQPTIENARKSLQRIPGGASVVDVETAREGRVSTYADTLGFAPGVFIQPRFGAEEARLSIRGSGLQRTFHMRGIKLLQDGVPLNQADGSVDFQAIEMLAASYIEVFRGANALQYGSTTLGGAINFVSPNGYTAAGKDLRSEFGSYGYRRLFGQFAGMGGEQSQVDYAASIGYLEQDGFRRHARQENTRFNGNLGLVVNRDIETRFFLALNKSGSELPGALTKAALEADPRQALLDNVIKDQRRDTRVNRLSNKTTFRLGQGVLEASAFHAEKKLFHPIFQVLDQRSYDHGIGLRYVLDTGPSRFVAGVAPAWGKTDEERWVNVGGARGAMTGRSRQEASNLEFYLEEQYLITPRTALIGGVQHTVARRKYTDRFLADGDASFNATYRRTSPKLGVRFDAAPQVQLYANVSASFEPPSFGELSGTGGVTNVRAQKGRTLELGSRGRIDMVDWDVSVYHAKLKDELLGQEIAPGRSITVNVPNTIHAGLEAAATVRPWKTLEWRNALLLNDFRYDDDPIYGNNRLPGIPRSLLKSELLHTGAGGIYGGVTVEWSPRRYAVDMANTLFADRYQVWGLKVGRRAGKESGFAWFAEARNLFDKKYAATTGVVANAAGRDQAQFFPGDGRMVSVGLEWKQ